MTQKRYDEIVDEMPATLAKWIRYVTKLRLEDIGNADQTNASIQDAATAAADALAAVAATIPVKASGAEVDTGTDDAKFLTAKAVNDSHNVPDVAPGASGNQMVSNGTDWVSSAPVLPGMVLLATRTAANSASLDFKSVINSTYSSYIFEIDDLLPATDTVNLLLRTSTDNGATFDSGAGNYSWGIQDTSLTSGAVAADGSASATEIQLNASDTSARQIGNAAAEGVSGTLELRSPLGTVRQKIVTFVSTFQNPSTVSHKAIGGGVRLSTSDIDAAQFLFSSGNIVSGSVRCYGLRAT